MSYLKIVDNEIVEAPSKIERDGKMIYGYNKQNNEAMLYEDGYEFYPKTILDYIIINGQIIPKPIPEPIINTIYTKLQIRRAMRKLNIEFILNSILLNYPQFKTEWDDAVEIDIADPLIQMAINQGIITQEIYDRIVEELQKNDNSEQI